MEESLKLLRSIHRVLLVICIVTLFFGYQRYNAPDYNRAIEMIKKLQEADFENVEDYNDDIQMGQISKIGNTVFEVFKELEKQGHVTINKDNFGHAVLQTEGQRERVNKRSFKQLVDYYIERIWIFELDTDASKELIVGFFQGKSMQTAQPYKKKAGDTLDWVGITQFGSKVHMNIRMKRTTNGHEVYVTRKFDLPGSFISFDEGLEKWFSDNKIKEDDLQESLESVAFEIKDRNFQDSLEHLRKLNSWNKNILPVFGVRIDGELVILFSPLAILLLLIYLLAHTKHLSKIVQTNEKVLFEFPWIPIISDRLSITLSYLSTVFFPTITISILVIIFWQSQSWPLLLISIVLGIFTMIVSIFIMVEVHKIKKDIKMPYGQNIIVTSDNLKVDLSDGRSIEIPLTWFPRLIHATEEERNNWKILGKGEAIHWNDIDEDISIESLLIGKPSEESQSSLEKWLSKRKIQQNSGGDT